MEFTLKTIIASSPELIYNAWLDSEQHSQMTGGEAFICHNTIENFTTWDGYITGKNIELHLNKKIVQSWRTTEFDDNDNYSIVEIVLKEVDLGTELTLTHSNLPDNGEQYIAGWENHYFGPMKRYFGSK